MSALATFGGPALFALFVWWFSTGAIMYLNNLPRRTFRWSMLAATAILVLSLFGLSASAEDTTTGGAYVAFACGVLIWGWLEISFYMGFVTGPRRVRCPTGCRGPRHFRHAVETVLYHELAIVLFAGVVLATTWHGSNQVGTFTFLILWWMHTSAKLNVFLGVRNLNEHFLPESMRYLAGFFSSRPINLFFPLSVTVSTIVTAFMWDTAVGSGAAPAEQTGTILLAVLMTLAVLEHWFLVLPLPAADLWKWSLPSRGAKPAFDRTGLQTILGRRS